MTVNGNGGDAPLLPVDAVMTDVRARVRSRLRDQLRAAGITEFGDQELFDAVEAIFGHALEVGGDGLLLPRLLDDLDTWRLDTALRWRTHRPRLGRLLIAVKRSVLLPLSRWLFEYSRDNFLRQQRLNDILLACLQTLAVEHVRLRLEIERLRLAPDGDRPPTSPLAP